jgi:tellurite resistance protein TerC
MGLRQLYFLLGGLLNRLAYLSVGLAIVLGFIGVKLILEALHSNNVPFINAGAVVPWAPEIPIKVSLGVIAGTLIVTTIASLVRTRRQRSRSKSVVTPVPEPQATPASPRTDD